jgi:hypothetical protein
MKRIIASLAIGFSALTGQAHAWVGGPFDNGFHNASFENGVYQAALTFKNGGGYSYFSPNQAIASDDASTPTLIDQRGSRRNRAVLYYKGISYVGSAFGTADGEARDIQCTMNGTSESTYQTAATQQQTSAFTLTTSTSSALSTTVVSSSRSFNFNGHWEGKITSTAPSLRFSGKGELAFLAPGGADSIAGLAFSGFAGLIDAIITAVGNADTTGTSNFPATFFSDAGDSITDILTQMADPTSDIGKIISQSGIDATFDNAEVIKLKVTGTRRF